MAEIQAFRGWRYNLTRMGKLADVIAPPYDVIDDALSARLHEKSEYNVIRLDLDPVRPGDDDNENRYTRSAKRLKDWQRDGVLVEEREPAIYVYYQKFDWEGRTYTRRGFMARVRLEEFGKGKIYPHEETLSGPKADRLKLFRATGMNLSQIFGLYPDETNRVAGLLDEAVARQTPLEAVDHLDVIHRMWTVSDPRTIQTFQSALADKPIFIADGHHRYETSCTYRREREQAGQISGPDDAANFTLMMFVGMSEPGLQIMPTHRLVTGVGNLTSRELQDLLMEHFEFDVVGVGPTAADRAWKRIADSGRQNVLGFGTVADDTWICATLRSPASMDAVVKDHSPAWKGLGVAILHRLVLDYCLKKAGPATCQYVHLLREVQDAVRAKTCQLACLVPPATVEHIRTLSSSFEKMPPKSTYFYPKLATGLVFNPIR